MRYKPLSVAAIFFGLFFTGRGGGGMAPWTPTWIRYCTYIHVIDLFYSDDDISVKYGKCYITLHGGDDGRSKRISL